MPLRLVHRPKSPYWIIRGTVRRIRVEESSGTSDKRVAEEIRAKREAEILAESSLRSSRYGYLRRGILKLFGIGRRQEVFGTCNQALRDHPIGQNRPGRYRPRRRKLYPLVSASTRNRQFYTPTSAVLKHAAKRGWCSAIILERPSAPPSRIRWLTLEEANRLIECSGDHLRPLGHVSALHGCARWRSLVARLAQRRSYPQPCDFR